jgi:hypothetical protein
MKPNYPNVDSPEKQTAFFKKASEMAGGCTILPQGRMVVPEEYGGNAGHLFHDCRGIVTGYEKIGNGYLEVRGLIPFSDVDVFRRCAKENYVSKASLRFTSTDEEIIKN